MKLHRLMFAALLAGAAAVPAAAQVLGQSARSNMPEENELIRVLGETMVHGNGANGVPPGVNVSYTVGNVNRCAPRIVLWTGREGSSASGPGPAKALPMTRVANVVLQGSTQLKVEFADGSDLLLAANSEAHRSEMLGALQAFASACRSRRG